jgi:aspartate racemase
MKGHMARPKHIGIVAVSAEGAALCYRTICTEAAALLGPHSHPEITMHTYPLSQYMQHVVAAEWEEAADVLRSSAEKLAAVGAELIISPDNTLHQAVDLVRSHSPIRWLHIAEEVAAVAADRRLMHVGVLGTRYLMEGPVYPSKLAGQGIQSTIPDAPARQRINEIIFDELVYGRLENRSRSYFCEVILHLASWGCQGVVLGCTEIPLLISDSDSPLPTLDSTRILARAALREALHDVHA